MSNSLRQTIIIDVSRREDERKKQEEEKKRVERKRCEKKIFEYLEKNFSQCLDILCSYHEHTVLDAELVDCGDVLNTAKELGFNCNKMGRGDKLYIYKFSIPNFQEGNERTPAQERLFEFEKQLKKARKKRVPKLVTECRNIIELLREGRYEYKIYPQNRLCICVESEEKITSAFEEEFIKKFFNKYKITFSSCKNNNWYFFLEM